MDPKPTKVATRTRLVVVVRDDPNPAITTIISGMESPVGILSVLLAVDGTRIVNEDCPCRQIDSFIQQSLNPATLLSTTARYASSVHTFASIPMDETFASRSSGLCVFAPSIAVLLLLSPFFFEHGPFQQASKHT